MRRVCLVFLWAGDNDFDVKLAERLKIRGLDVESNRIKYEWMYDLSYVRMLKRLILERSKSAYVVFFGDSSELFFYQADLQLCFSAYSRWFDHHTIRIVPHAWPPLKLPSYASNLDWNEKPPLRLGFMGRTFRSVKATRYASRFPRSVKDWMIGGHLKRHPEALGLLQQALGTAVKTVNAFPRLDTILSLEARHKQFGDIELEVAESHFVGSSEQLSDYEQHLKRNTYIICPRGTENYSYRSYEALGFGRIPVIIDTDMVLPTEIDWDTVALRIPYGSVDKLYEAVQKDYVTHSPEQFRERQRAAFAASARILSFCWIDEVAQQIASNLINTSPLSARKKSF